MPYFIECLGDIEEDCCTQALSLYAFSDLMDDPVRLMDGRMASSKAKLVITEKRREVNITSEPFQQEFLKNL
jgi:hypothetical protein